MFQICIRCFAHIPRYHPSTSIDWRLLKLKTRVATLMRTRTRVRPCKQVIPRFRLTRFGWERLRAYRHCWKRRRLPHKMIKRSRKIDYIHRGIDLERMKKYMPQMILRIRMPKFENVNILPVRQLLPGHFR